MNSNSPIATTNDVKKLYESTKDYLLNERPTIIKKKASIIDVINFLIGYTMYADKVYPFHLVADLANRLYTEDIIEA